MITIPFVKAHGARNDFLLSWESEVAHLPLSEIAIAICDRNAGVGADGWQLVGKNATGEWTLRLFNADGGEVEMSGNGTRCAAAFLVATRSTDSTLIRIHTGAGPKDLTLLQQSERSFLFDMNMGSARVRDGELYFKLSADGREWNCTLLNVGNPQCAVFVDHFDFPWAEVGAEIERHPHFPHRTNVSFIRVLHRNRIEVRFFERGVGVTNSSGTGSTGAAAACLLRGLVDNPINVQTPAGDLNIRQQNDQLWLTGPAVITVSGEFYHQETIA
jgi:diaminopimelate epimerase